MSYEQNDSKAQENISINVDERLANESSNKKIQEELIKFRAILSIPSSEKDLGIFERAVTNFEQNSDKQYFEPEIFNSDSDLEKLCLLAEDYQRKVERQETGVSVFTQTFERLTNGDKVSFISLLDNITEVAISDFRQIFEPKADKLKRKNIFANSSLVMDKSSGLLPEPIWDFKNKK
jgi:hypothetical protein